MQHRAAALRLIALSACFIAAISEAQIPSAGSEIRLKTERTQIRVKTITDRLEHPWAMAFLPDGRVLVTERPGRLRIVTQDGVVSPPVAGVPKVFAENQGGLLDVVLDPDFASNRRIYLSYAEARGGKTSGTTVARGELRNDKLEQVQVIFRQQPSVESAGHFGSRLVFARDGTLFVTLGERQSGHFSPQAQHLDSHLGKVVRIHPDGSTPPDNPFVDHASAKKEIWSLGHRNAQGAALHPDTGEIWVTEHGPRGGDELNIVRPGKNYGWPEITHGVAYSGAKIGVGTEKAGMEQPLHYWVPSIGATGLTFYSGRRIPEWKGNLLSGGLVSRELTRLELDGNRVVHEERLLKEINQRIRDVREDLDGAIWIATDSPTGRLLRIDKD